MIKITFIISGLSTGGAEMMLFKLLSRMDRQRFLPRVISLTSAAELGPKIAALGVNVEALGLKPGLSGLAAFVRLVRMIRCSKPDVIHTWMYHADLVGGLAAICAGRSVVAWCIRNSDFNQATTKLSTRFVVRLCALVSRWIPNAIVSCSEKARFLHVSYGYKAELMHVIPNGFDVGRFRANSMAGDCLRRELRLSTETLLVGLVGRFDPQKNHEGFFEAAQIVRSHMPNVHFVLAGRSIDNGNELLMQIINRHGVLASSHLLGLRDDMPDVMAALDVLVCSSSYGEAFPNVLGEAMASEVPCITTNVGDSAWIVADTGWVVPPDDPKGLADSILNSLSLTRAERVAIGRRARQRVIQHFEISQIVKRYEQFYAGLLI